MVKNIQFEQNLILIIYIYKQGIIITGDFTAYIGKVQLDNGKIIDIPPLKFKKHVLIEKYSGLDDAFSKGVPRKRNI